MSVIKIREAVVSDLPGMLDLYAQHDYDDGCVLSLEAAEVIFSTTARYPFYKFYVAVVEGVVVGTFALLVMENIGHLGARSALLESVAVDPARQGEGVGQEMMRTAMQIASEHDCYKLALSSSVKRDRAHRFYEKLGFRMYGYSLAINLVEAAA